MNILVITQDEPFYLKDNFNYLINILPKKHKIVGCVVSHLSPYGKKERFFKKSFKTLKIFGLKFFIYYGIKFILSKIFDSSIKTLLKKKSIPIIQIRGSINSAESLKLINSYKPDLLVSILGNQIFKKRLINLAPMGCINLHTALLPKYRGLMPTFWVLKNDEKYTGISVFFVDEGIDSGPIIVQKKIEINTMTQKQLILKTKKIGMELIVDAINLIHKKKVKLIPNPHEKSTYFSFPKKKDVIEFKRKGKKFF